MNKSDSITKLATALAKAQGELKPASKDTTNPFLKNKFADLGSVIEAVRGTLAKHELSFVQIPVSEGETIGIETVLLHSSGEWLSGTVYLPLDDEKGISRSQVAGKVITYLRRYALSAVLGVYADEDTDGNSTGKVERIRAAVSVAKNQTVGAQVLAESDPANSNGERKPIVSAPPVFTIPNGEDKPKHVRAVWRVPPADLVGKARKYGYLGENENDIAAAHHIASIASNAGFTEITKGKADEVWQAISKHFEDKNQVELQPA